jgi:CubicO group peptidase (beta-lactamase class C family)
MKRSKCIAAAFSLVELTLAMGLAAFCLIAVFGLIPVAALANRNATSQTAATNVMAAVIADLRGTPRANSASMQFAIPFGTNTTRYFDSQRQCSCDSAGLQRPNPATRDCTSLTWNPPLQPRYQLDITWSGSTTLRYADLKVRWPPVFVTSSPAPIPSGSTEVFAAFDRN